MQKNRSKQYLIFISHSTKDSWVAKQMASLLENRGAKSGLKTFLDAKDIEGGDPIPDTIRKNISDCSEFVVLLTADSISRPWVLIEIGAAWARKKRIVAIIDKIAPSDMPQIIAPYKAIDLNNFDDYIAQVLKRLRV